MQMLAANDNQYEQIQQYHQQMQNLLQQQAVINTYEQQQAHQIEDISQPKNQDSKMGVTQKKTHKVIRKSSRHNEQQIANQELLLSQQNSQTKSLDRVSSINQAPQNSIQINCDYAKNQIQDQKMYTNNFIKFQSTSTKSNGAKKIKVTPHDVRHANDLVYIQQRTQITNNNSLVNIEKLPINHAEPGQIFVTTEMNKMQSLNQSILHGHKKNILSSNYGSGTNLQFVQPVHKLKDPNIKVLSKKCQISQNMHGSQQRRKQSIQKNLKKIGISDHHPQINSNITQELMNPNGGIITNQSKTTKNSNYYPIEANSLSIQMKNSAGGNKTNVQQNAMVENQKMNQGKHEFNCLINNGAQQKGESYGNQDAYQYQGQQKQIYQRIVSAGGNSKNKNNQMMMVNNEMVQNNINFQKQMHTNNHSQFRMRQDCAANQKNSLDNLHNQQNNEFIKQNQNFDFNQKVVNSYNNTQGINIQNIMLESEDTFTSDVTKKPINSKRLHQTQQLNQVHLKKQQNETISKQIEASKAAGIMNMGPKNMIGPYIIQNNKQLAQQVVQGVPTMKFFNQINSSSATNRAKKAFTFEIDPSQKIKHNKNKGSSAIAFSNKHKQPSVSKNVQNQNQIAHVQSNKKLIIQNKQKLKTQMNLTGPMPKTMLSPKANINKSQGKTKHSQYFNNDQEIVMQNQYMLPQKLNNGHPNFNLVQMTPQNTQGELQLFYQNQNLNNNQINQHQHQQYSVNLNGVPSHGNQLETSSPRNVQPQITTSTQGCNTVININIDSNTFRRLHNDTHNKNETNPSALNNQSIQNQNSSQHKSNNKTRQTSSKMKRNDSISSNRSKKVGQNRRSNSGSQMRQQQINAYQHISHLSGLSNFNQPTTFTKNQSPKSNTDIIMNNIAMINQKLHQQEAVNYCKKGENLQININRVNDNAKKNLSSTLKKNPKLVQKPKDTPILDLKAGKMFGINSHLFNQTQKVANQSNPNPITQNEQPAMYSIIPKKVGVNDQDNFSAGFKTQNFTQKLTLKKISKTKKSDAANSNVDSARTPGKSVGNNKQMYQQQNQAYAQNQPQSHFYNNQNTMQASQQEEMIDQLLNMENAIQQNQIKLRNELLQMQNSLSKNKKTSQKNQSIEKINRSQIMQQDNMDDSSTLINQFEVEQEESSKNYNFAPQINLLLHQNLMEQSRTGGQMSQGQSRDYNTQCLPSNGISKQYMHQNQQTNRVPAKGAYQMMSIQAKAKPNRSTGNSVQGGQINKPKMNIEDINIEIDDFSQLSQNMMFNDLNQALNYISTKKSVSTKNQFNQQKIQTQNVQNLLREAKREMVVDSNSHDNNGDQILVGGDDLSQNEQAKKKISKFNFHGTQNLRLSNQQNNFQVIQPTKGFTPQNNQAQICDFDIKDFHSQGTVASSSTFGLGQINKKKQIIKQTNPNQDYNNIQVYNQQQSSGNKTGKSAITAVTNNLSISTSNNKKDVNKKIILQKQKSMALEGVTAPFQQQQMKQSMQFPKKNVEQASQQILTTDQNDQNYSSLTGTMPSQVSDYNIQNQRNSNMPPGSQIQGFDSDNLLIDSKLSEIEQLEIQTTNPPSALFVQQESSEKPLKPLDDELKLPISGAKVLRHYLKRSGLTEYEKSEVLDFKQIYFLGLGSEKINGSKFKQFNFGYDDDRGDYNVVLKDHISYRFEVIDFLGKGSFGQALKVFDHKTQEIVAIKIIRNKKKFQHQAGVELKILLHLRDNDPDDTNNIIRIKDYCNFRKHLIISFELFSINVYEFIKNNNFEGVSLSLIRRFAIQILQALKYLREEDLIHCDLKPENILLKSPDKSGIKVIDFGSSCFSNERIYTYIQSRFYRAPEIILGIPYTSAIDMWSFGCILAELFTGIPIFPGESEQEQLSMIIQVLGLPDEKTLDHASRKKIFFDEETNKPHLTSNSQGELRVPLSRPLEQVLMCQSDSFLDFIRKCLEWNPEKRITPFDALMHEWIIEGLPPQVLVHHKKMLGIYESETDEEYMLNEHSQFQPLDSVINDSQGQIMIDTSQYDHMNDLIDKQDLSSSIMQGFDDIDISNDEMSSRHNMDSEQRPSQLLHIDFYGNSEKVGKQNKGINRAQIIAAQSRYSVEKNEAN